MLRRCKGGGSKECKLKKRAERKERQVVGAKAMDKTNAKKFYCTIDLYWFERTIAQASRKLRVPVPYNLTQGSSRIE